MKHRKFSTSILMALTFCVLLLANGFAQEPILEFKFNNRKEPLHNSGIGPVESWFFAPNGNREDMELSKKTGLTGTEKDGAFDNSDISMGVPPGGYIEMTHLADALREAKSFTVILWMKSTEILGKEAFLLNIGSDDKSAGLIIRAYDLRERSEEKMPPGIALRLNGEYLAGVVNPLLNETNEWIFIAMTVDAIQESEGFVAVYIGTKQTIPTLCGSRRFEMPGGKINALNITSTLGAVKGGLVPYGGLIDNFRFYASPDDNSGALAADRILEIYHQDLSETP